MSIDSSNDMALWFQGCRLYAAEARYLDDEDYERWLGPAGRGSALPDADAGHPFSPRRSAARSAAHEFLQRDAGVAANARVAAGDRHRLVREPAYPLRASITNVEVFPGVGQELRALSNFIVYRHRLEREDVLRPVDGELRLARRTVLLDRNVLLSKNLNVYL